MEKKQDRETLPLHHFWMAQHNAQKHTHQRRGKKRSCSNPILWSVVNSGNESREKKTWNEPKRMACNLIKSGGGGGGTVKTSYSGQIKTNSSDAIYLASVHECNYERFTQGKAAQRPAEVSELGGKAKSTRTRAVKWPPNLMCNREWKIWFNRVVSFQRLFCHMDRGHQSNEERHFHATDDSSCCFSR